MCVLVRLATAALSGLLPVLIATASTGHAQTLSEVLSEIYQSNPVLLSAREALKARDESRPQALSGWMPTVQLSGSAFQTRQHNLNLPNAYFGDRSYELSYRQNLYRSGSDSANLRRSESLIRQQRAILLDTEEELLLQGVIAYMDVLRDEAIIGARIANVGALNENLRQTDAQYRIGDRTESDRAQAQARLASAEADLVQARGDLEASRARFREIAGLLPTRLVAPPRLPAPNQPLDSLTNDALSNDPRVIAAGWAIRVAAETVGAIAGEAGPSLDVVARVARSTRDYDSTYINTGNTDRTVGVQVTVPLYQGGGVGARVREARRTVTQREADFEAERRATVRRVRIAWETLRTNEVKQTSLEKSVQSATIALASTRRSSELGEATVLDVLNAERDLINEQVRLASTNRDFVVSSYSLTRETGDLTAERLALPVAIYDPIANYTAARWNVFPDLLTILAPDTRP